MIFLNLFVCMTLAVDVRRQWMVGSDKPFLQIENQICLFHKFADVNSLYCILLTYLCLADLACFPQLILSYLKRMNAICRAKYLHGAPFNRVTKQYASSLLTV